MIPEDLRNNGDIDLDEAHPYDGDMDLYENFKKEQVSARGKAGNRRRAILPLVSERFGR